MIEPIISGVFLALACVAALLGFLFGMRKKWQYTMLKIATTVIATIVAVIIARAVPAKGFEALTDMIVGVLPETFSADIKNVLTTPEVKDSIMAMVSMILAPLLFSLLFIIIKPILGIAKAPLARLWINKAEKNKTWNNNSLNYDKWGKKKLLEHRKFRMSSALLGAFSGILLAYVISIPTVFGLSITGKIAKPIVANFTGDDSVFTEVCDAAIDNRVVTVMELTGGGAIYDAITSYNVNGHTAYLSNEVDFISTTANALTTLTKDGSNYNSAAAKQALDDIARAFEKTTIIPSIIPGIISNIDAKWDNGEAFCGLYKVSFGEALDPITNTLFDIIGDTTYDNIKTDFNTGLKLIGIFAENGSMSSQIKDPIALLSNKETNIRIFETIYENTRFYPIVPAFIDCGINLISDSLGIHDNAKASYINLVNDLIKATQNICDNPTAYTQNGVAADDYGADAEELAILISEILENYGIDAKTDSCVTLANKLLKQNIVGNLTADTTAQALTKTEIIIVEADGITESGVQLSFVTFEEKTQLLFANDIKINRDAPADTHREATLLADAFSKACSIMQTIQSEGLNTKTFIVDLGYLLDCFDQTHAFGSGLSRHLLICMFQSNKALSVLNMDLIDITHLANEICDASENKSYSALLQDLANTIEILELASKNDNIADSVADLIQNLTPPSITILQQFTTAETMNKYGLSGDAADKTSEFISNMLGNLGEAKGDNSLTDDQYDAESKAVADMMNIAMNSSGADSLFGEDSVTGTSASEFVDRITNSQVMSQTIVDTVYNEQDEKTVNPLHTSIELNDDQKTEFIEAMNAQLAGAETDAEKQEMQKTLLAIAAIVNLDAQVNNNGTIVLP